MGQDWAITAPRKNEVLDFGGKLGEILFDGSARCLVMLLAVPVLPVPSMQDRAGGIKRRTIPGEQLREEKVDQREGLSSVGPQCMKRKREMEDDASESAIEIAQSRKLPKPNASGASREVQTEAEPPTLSSLPIELSNLIFEDLDMEDVLNLSLTSHHFWNVGRGHIQDYFWSFLGPWAGQSIICVGQDTEAGDYPPNMVTEDEEKELQESLDEYGQPMTLYNVTEDYTQIKSDVSLPATLLGQLLRSKQYYRMSDPDQHQALKAVHPELSGFYPRDQLWILRNLTTREYVRADGIALTSEHIHGPEIDGIGFGEVILSRVCWSTSPSVAMGYDGNIHRGIWAGHRFDITTLGRHREDIQEGIWRDISEEVAKEVGSIWESEYGSGWRRRYGKGTES